MQLVTAKDPSLVFLSETRLYENKDDVTRSLDMVGNFVVERSDDCVGLMLLWIGDVQVTLLSFSRFHIDVELEFGFEKFRFTDMYRRYNRTRKHEV
ncbi:hypothetical protein V6N13_004955 [Hibiscus sabdariffa]